MDTITVIVTLAVAVFGSTGFWTWVLSQSQKHNDETRLLMGLAFSKIIQQSEMYIERGHISIDEYKELYHYLYEPYKNMGGNGTAEKLMNEVKNLPTEKQ